MKIRIVTTALFLMAFHGQAQGLTGTWTWGKQAASGGTLKLVDEQGKISFQLTCYRMRSSQFVGDISGEVQIRNNRGLFTSDELPDCSIQFIVRPGNIVLKQTGAGDCEFGTGVVADGTYKRMSTARPTFD